MLACCAVSGAELACVLRRDWISLRSARYAMSSTAIAYGGAMFSTAVAQGGSIRLRACYAMSGTGLVYTLVYVLRLPACALLCDVRY
eukprot:3619130-Rhodomonas_salina.1